MFHVMAHNDFNSIKVQLSLYKHLPASVIPALFQFHKGTIKPLN